MLLFVIPKRLRQQIERHPPIATLVELMVGLVGVFIVLTCALQLVERRGWEIAYWMSWETLSTVGYGDHPAETSMGRILSVLVGSVGIVMASGTIGASVILFTYREERRRTGLVKNPLKDGYVLFNFPGTQQALSFIHEVRDVEPDVGICIVDSQMEKLPLAIAHLPKIHFVKGSSLDWSTYERARLRDNRIAIVFPRDCNNVESDGHTRTTVDLINQYVEGRVRVLHVLVDPRQEWMFAGLKSTRVLECLEVLALVQECQDPYSALIAERLLKNTEGANPKTIKADRLEGITWYELQARISKLAHDLDLHLNLLALIRDGGVVICPPSREIIKRGDHISVATFNDFDWHTLEEKLAGERRVEEASPQPAPVP